MILYKILITLEIRNKSEFVYVTLMSEIQCLHKVKREVIGDW